MADQLWSATDRLDRWIVSSNWEGYDPFDGLSAPFARRLTFEIPLLRMVLQQTVRRTPINLRPLLGIPRRRSTKAMGYFAAGYLRLYQLTGEQQYLDRAIYRLEDLQQNFSRGYSGLAWGNAFDYQLRDNYSDAETPTVVWTSFIGYSFVDAFELLGDKRYLDAARSACEFILRDLSRTQLDGSVGISYVPHQQVDIHNSNLLAASLLARVYKHTQEAELLDSARQSARYTLERQRPDGAWWYGEGPIWRRWMATTPGSCSMPPTTTWKPAATISTRIECTSAWTTTAGACSQESCPGTTAIAPTPWTSSPWRRHPDLRSCSGGAWVATWPVCGSGELGHRQYAGQDRLLLLPQAPLHDEEDSLP